MALARIGCSADFAAFRARFAIAAPSVSVDHHRTNGVPTKKPIKAFHVSGVRRYPEAPQLPLPSNVSEIFGNETGRFTSERSRDITAPVLLYSSSSTKSSSFNSGCNNGSRMNHVDTHVDSYDCFGAVSLNSSMQSNVPIPFSSTGKSMHLNMPGGHWASDGKYIAEDMRKSQFSIAQFQHQKRRGFDG